VIRTDTHIRIEAGNGTPVEIDAPFGALESAFTERIGFPLPIDSLRFWLLGVPEPGYPWTGEGGSFQQGGWDIAVSEYTAVSGAPAALPMRLVLTRASTRIRVLVDRWEAVAP
jgi:outer membrane lipoprotein LolB